MTTDATTRPLRSATTTIALVAATLITFQLLAARVAALRLHLPFGSLVAGNALFGLAVAGAVLALWERSWRLLPEAWSRRACLGFLVSLPLAWSWLVVAPTPESLAEGGAWLHLAGFAIAGALPFTFGGAAIGVLLGANARSVHVVLAAALGGAGVACALAPLAVPELGAGGSFLLALVLAMAAAAASGPMDAPARAALILCAAGGAFFAPRFDGVFRIEAAREVAWQPGRALSLPAGPEWSQWSPAGRTELLRIDSAPGDLPAAPTSEGALPQLPPPDQWWMAQAGDRGAVITDYGSHPELAAALLQSDSGLAVALANGSTPKVCVLGLGGGREVQAALQSDALRVRAIEPDGAVLELHATAALSASRALFTDPRMELVVDDPRAALLRSDERFDVLVTTALDTWTSLHGGAVALHEDYQVTVPAFATMLDRLVDGGILQSTRLAGGPETVRLLGNLWQALGDTDRAAFATAIAVVRGDATGRTTVLYRKGGFAGEQQARLRSIVAAAGLDGVVLPDADLRAQVERDRVRLRALEEELARLDGEIQRRTEGIDDKELQRLRTERAVASRPLDGLRTRLCVADYVLAADKHEFAAAAAFDVTPTSDDRPFFLDLVRPTADAAAIAGAATPLVGPDVSMGFLRWQLLLGALVGTVLLGLPMLFRGGAASGSRTGALRFLIYFAGCAVGGVCMHVALMQKFALLLGPQYLSTVVTLAALLGFAAFGALLSHSLLNWEPQRGRVVAIGLFVSAALVAFLAPAIVELCVGLSLPWRVAVTALVTAPVGTLIGMPLPHGVRVVERVNPSLVPWSIAVTAVGLALGAVGAVAVAVSFGYAAVLFASGVVSLVSMLAIDGLARDSAPSIDAVAEVADEQLELAPS